MLTEMAVPGTVFEGPWCEKSFYNSPEIAGALRWREASNTASLVNAANAYAEALLKRQEAAKLDIETKIEGEKTTVVVKVQSLVPHNLPTTHPAWATVVLDLDIKGKNLRTVFADKRPYGRVYQDAKGQKTSFDFEAVKVLEDTVLKPEEVRVETFTFPTPKDTKTFDVEATLSYAPITGPAPFLQRVEAESTKGSSDPVFQPIEIVKRSENIPVNK